ncbi:MAG: hypothetical protein EHM18_16095 [Acidobacteria bacterium]|nr:MAG: hypothetical protein EHM18_16095 [Acidobacteriota bacterium]
MRLSDSKQTFPAFAETSAAEAWVAKLLDHHRKVQRQKPPAGKKPWFETFDDGSVAVRTMYRWGELALHDGSYVHAYRTNSLVSLLDSD